MRDPSASVTGVRDEVTTRKMQLLVRLRFSAIASNVNFPEGFVRPIKIGTRESIGFIR
jgi:hypothetical protein